MRLRPCHTPNLVIGCVLLVAPIAACGDDDAGPAAAGAGAGGLVATIGTNRLYAPDHELGLGLRNTGDADVRVVEVQLESSLFEEVAASPADVVLPAAGRRLVLPVAYGEARCDGHDDRDAATFAAVVVLDDGRALEVPATEDHDGALGRLHARECAAADVRERVDIAFGDEWARDGIAVNGELLLEQREHGEPVALDDAVGNVIFTLHVDAETTPILRVSDDEPAASVPVTISADRCDPHAVAEFKRPFVFLSWATVGDGASVPVELEVTGAARAALEDLLATC